MAETSRKVRIHEALWDKKESSYGAAIGDGEAGSWAALFDGEPWNVKPSFIDDMNETGKGHEWRGNRRAVSKWEANVSRSRLLDNRVAGWLGAFGLGAVSTANGANVNTHTFKPLAQSSGVQIPSTTVVENQADETLKRKMSGVCVGGFTIDAKKGAPVRCSYDLVGSGKADDTTGITLPSITYTAPFKFTALSTANFGPDGSPNNIIALLRGVRFQFNNDLQEDDGYLAGSTEISSSTGLGPAKQKLEYGMRSWTMTIDIDARRSAYTEWTAFLTQALWECKFVMRGALVAGSDYEELEIEVPELYIADLTPGWDGPIKIYTATVHGRYVSGDASPFLYKVRNTVATYLSAAA